MTKIYDRDLDLAFAQSLYEIGDKSTGRTYLSHRGKSLLYSPAYAVTNEELRDTVRLIPSRGARVLTVAGSGDQPLFYALYNAKAVDTFDVSFCAKAIMDIKTAAIQQGLSFDKYTRLLNDLHRNNTPDKNATLSNLLNSVPGDTAKFTTGMNGYRIFSNGWRPSNYTDETLSPDEYDKLQSMGIKNFNFIWSNISDLHTHISGEYDIINLSNIFEWSPELLVPSVKNLRNYIRKGGHILVQSGHPISMHKNYAVFAKAQMAVADWARVWLKTENSENNILMLQRIR